MTGTTRTLHALLADRQQAWKAMNCRGRRRDPAEQRALASRAAERFRAADFLLVAELRSMDYPAAVTLDGRPVTLHLTPDRLHFVICDAGTGRPDWLSDHDHRSALYRYPAMEVAS